MPQDVDQRTRNWIGRTLIDRAGQRIGRVEDIYTDDVGRHPAWIAVATGRFGLNVIFLPFAGATPAGGDELRVQFPKELIKEAPVAGRGGRLTKEEVVRLYDHYGFDLEAEEVRERAMKRRANRPCGNYRPASSYGPAPAEEPARPVRRPAAPTGGPAPASRPMAALALPAALVETPAAPRHKAPAPTVKPAAAEKPATDTPAAPAKQARPPSSLFRDIVDPTTATDQPDARRDSPLFWNHDDRIDSIRPPRQPAHPGRR